MDQLARQLLISTGVVSLTVLVHLVGLDLLLGLKRVHLARFTTAWVRVDRLIVPLGLVMGLFVLHGLEIWGWAFVFLGLHALPTLEQALYFSTTTYSTLGEGGAVLPEGWRVLGALEAINGMLLIGWSTAFLFQMLHHLMNDDEAHPLPKGAITPRGRGRQRRVERSRLPTTSDRSPEPHASPEGAIAIESPRDRGSGSRSPSATN